MLASQIGINNCGSNTDSNSPRAFARTHFQKYWSACCIAPLRVTAAGRSKTVDHTRGLMHHNLLYFTCSFGSCPIQSSNTYSLVKWHMFLSCSHPRYKSPSVSGGAHDCGICRCSISLGQANAQGLLVIRSRFLWQRSLSQNVHGSNCRYSPRRYCW
ncbi:hypothetical protein CY34DRAFT_745495 [Suillus luteus UH-Slu-Lm8-n1]|uniref:Uncharacterized protein n=1 Tax=Suillus luteus UH-Slu-Lm8-n1 TaxID=930992 RepID=A0A0D0AFF4_9AGAM|nr:hypothetical protein CY34DRAFT_745495 [Suillus luteus UH-Slu-Lm8-n1]